LQEGAFNGAPTAISQTADGYLWIGTQTGLVRFDGVQFLPWTSPDGKHLPSTTISALLGARDGSLWIGMEGGLSRWDKESLTNYRTKQERINSIIEDRDGTVWFTRSRANDADGPLCRILKERTQCYGTDDGIPLLDGAGALIEDAQSRLWFAGSAEIVRWNPGVSRTFSRNDLKSKKGIGGIFGLAPNPDGAVWVGLIGSGPGKGLQQIVREAWKPFATPELDGSTLEVQALFLDRKSVLWIGTVKQGIYRIRSRKVDHFNSADGLSSDAVYQFYEDHEGNLWTVTARGIDCFRDLPMVSFSTREGLSVDEVDSVLAARDGTIWIGTPAGLSNLRQDGIHSFHAQRRGGQITSLLEDHIGRLWVGSDNTVSSYDRGMLRRISRPDGRPMGVVAGIAEDMDHNIWIETIGSPRTLIRIQDLKVKEMFPVPEMPPARKVAADPQGGIWLGLMNGNLARYHHGEIQIYRFNLTAAPRVNQLLVASDGSVLGATAAGLIGWKRGKQQTLGVRNGLPCDGIFAFVFDNQGSLWLYTECGLVQLQSVEVQKWWDNPDGRVRVRTFDAHDGVQPGPAPFNAAAKSPDGRLWFANGLALQMIDPEHLDRNTVVPPVHVESVVADRKSYSPVKDLRLPALMRDLQIDYTAPSFRSPQKVRFRYRLEGRDADWLDAGTRRQAFYTDLRPGKYRFRVIACNNDGVWNKEGAALDFAIAPAWYQTVWFLVICVVTGILFMWFLHRLRVRQVAKVIGARFDERLAERTRMARDLHDTFLQTVQGSKLIADHALEKIDDSFRARQALGQLSEWLGRAVQEGRAALNSLRTSTAHSNDLAEALGLAMEECRMYAAMQVSFSVLGEAKQMHPVVSEEIYRIGSEAIRNACKHSTGKRLNVELKYGKDLTIRVRDDGVGIDPNVADQDKEDHFGLQGMQERVDRIGGELTLVSSTHSGTSITVIVPGNLAFRKSTSSAFEKLTAILKRKRPTSYLD
jgi:ligand-binding sensor domain-containing protein/two-component sensor histidine kinase